MHVMRGINSAKIDLNYLDSLSIPIKSRSIRSIAAGAPSETPGRSRLLVHEHGELADRNMDRLQRHEVARNALPAVA